MQRTPLIIAVSAVVAALTLIVSPWNPFEPATTEAAAAHREMAWVSLDTGEAYRGPVGAARSSANPGHAHLVPGLYCLECGEWRASPPLHLVEGNPTLIRCTTHDVPLSAIGPLDTLPPLPQPVAQH